MRIAVIGAGAIGNLVAGYLKKEGRDVCLIGTKRTVDTVREKGLRISGVKGNIEVEIEAFEKLKEIPQLAILAVKTQNIEEALSQNMDFLKDSKILTLQNGVCADEIVSKYIPKENILSSIIMFGSTCIQPAEVVHNFEGPWIMGSMLGCPDSVVENTADILKESFSVVISSDITGMKYLKIFVNANNCVPAILGLSMQEAFSDLNISRISIAVWREGLKVIAEYGINLVSLPGFPMERVTGFTSMPPDEAAAKFSGIMAGLSKEPLYGSVLQSIKRGRLSEIDYINGEFISLAEKCSLRAPLNEKLVEMVHTVEKTGRFFSKDELIEKTSKFVYDLEVSKKTK